MRILVAVEAVDGRKGIDSLVQLCREKLDADPFSGCLFVFRSRSATSIRILTYDGQGFWLAQKRLSKGRFLWWPKADGAARANRGISGTVTACSRQSGHAGCADVAASQLEHVKRACVRSCFL
jgi:transposase